jgi:hypothetical protein
MKTMKFVAAGVAVIGSALISSAQLSDDFDSYANKAAFDAVWTPSVGVGLDLNTAEFVSSPNSVKNAATATSTAAQSRRFLSTAAPGHNFSFQFDFYDYNAANNVRDYGMLYARSGTAWTDSLLQIIAIGKYNTGTATRYYGRVAFESTTYVLGDGAGPLLSGGWFQLNAPNAIGWHTAKVVGMSDPNFSGKTRLEFFIDNTLVGSVSNLGWQAYNWVVLGSGLSSTGGFISFDNLIVTIPEPSVAALGLMGGVGLLWLFRRRTV